jgi:hypothetical protein
MNLVNNFISPAERLEHESHATDSFSEHADHIIAKEFTLTNMWSVAVYTYTIVTGFVLFIIVGQNLLRQLRFATRVKQRANPSDRSPLHAKICRLSYFSAILLCLAGALTFFCAVISLQGLMNARNYTDERVFLDRCEFARRVPMVCGMLVVPVLQLTLLLRRYTRSNLSALHAHKILRPPSLAPPKMPPPCTLFVKIVVASIAILSMMRFFLLVAVMSERTSWRAFENSVMPSVRTRVSGECVIYWKESTSRRKDGTYAIYIFITMTGLFLAPLRREHESATPVMRANILADFVAAFTITLLTILTICVERFVGAETALGPFVDDIAMATRFIALCLVLWMCRTDQPRTRKKTRIQTHGANALYRGKHALNNRSMAPDASKSLITRALGADIEMGTGDVNAISIDLKEIGIEGFQLDDDDDVVDVASTAVVKPLSPSAVDAAAATATTAAAGVLFRMHLSRDAAAAAAVMTNADAGDDANVNGDKDQQEESIDECPFHSSRALRAVTAPLSMTPTHRNQMLSAPRAVLRTSGASALAPPSSSSETNMKIRKSSSMPMTPSVAAVIRRSSRTGALLGGKQFVVRGGFGKGTATPTTRSMASPTVKPTTTTTTTTTTTSINSVSTSMSSPSQSLTYMHPSPSMQLPVQARAPSPEAHAQADVLALSQSDLRAEFLQPMRMK